MRKMKKRGRGWWGERRRHSEAAKKGWRKRLSKMPRVPKKVIEATEALRSKRARAVDRARRAKIVLDPDDPRVNFWLKRPDEMDVEGVDTPGVRSAENRSEENLRKQKEFPKKLKRSGSGKEHAESRSELMKMADDLLRKAYPDAEIAEIETPYGKLKTYIIFSDEDINVYDGIAVVSKTVYNKLRMKSGVGYNARWLLHPVSEKRILIKDLRADKELDLRLDENVAVIRNLKSGEETKMKIGDLKRLLGDPGFMISGFERSKEDDLLNLPYIRDAVKRAKEEGLSVEPLPGKDVEYKGVNLPLKWRIGDHICELIIKEANPRGKRRLLYGDKKIKEKWATTKHDGKTVSRKIGEGEVISAVDAANLILFGIAVEEWARRMKRLEKLKRDDSWKRIAKRYYEEYSRKLGIRGIPLKFKKGYTRSGGITVFANGDPKEVRLSEDLFSTLFAVDEKGAEECLKFTIAHELAHIHLEHGKKRSPRILVEHEADKLAEKISGVSKEEKEKISLELAKKVNEVAGEEVFVTAF